MKFREAFKRAFHKHKFVRTGASTFVEINDWHIQKVYETKCSICDKHGDDAESYVRK